MGNRLGETAPAIVVPSPTVCNGLEQVLKITHPIISLRRRSHLFCETAAMPVAVAFVGSCMRRMLRINNLPYKVSLWDPSLALRLDHRLLEIHSIVTGDGGNHQLYAIPGSTVESMFTVRREVTSHEC